MDGGNTSTNGDTVTAIVNSTAAAPVLNLGEVGPLGTMDVLLGIVNTGITMEGIGQLVFSGIAGMLNPLLITNYGAPTNLTQVTVNDHDAVNGTDQIFVTTTAGVSNVTYTPLSPSSGQFTRGLRVGR